MKIDLKKDRKDLYRPAQKEFTEVDVPTLTYLAKDGHGDPNSSPAYAAAVTSLYATAYATKFAFRSRTADDFVVGPLEGLWASADPTAFTDRRKGDWDWTMMIALPEEVDREDVAQGLATAARKKPELPVLDLHVLELTEGRSLQIMHVGSYDDEGPALARLHHEVMPDRGLTFNGRHHEIYLGDPRRVAPEKLRTVLRQPVRSAD